MAFPWTCEVGDIVLGTRGAVLLECATKNLEKGYFWYPVSDRSVHTKRIGALACHGVLVVMADDIVTAAEQQASLGRLSRPPKVSISRCLTTQVWLMGRR